MRIIKIQPQRKMYLNNLKRKIINSKDFVSFRNQCKQEYTTIAVQSNQPYQKKPVKDSLLAESVNLHTKCLTDIKNGKYTKDINEQIYLYTEIMHEYYFEDALEYISFTFSNHEKIINSLYNNIDFEYIGITEISDTFKSLIANIPKESVHFLKKIYTPTIIQAIKNDKPEIMLNLLINIFENHDQEDVFAAWPDIETTFPIADLRGVNGETVLHIAYGTGALDLFTFVLEKYPQLLSVLDQHGRNFLCYLNYNGDLSDKCIMFDMAIKQGVNLHALDKYGNSVLYNFLEHINKNHFFCGEEDTMKVQEIIKLYLQFDAKSIRNSVENRTKLHILVAAGLSLELDKNINLIDAVCAEQGMTPLHYAILLNNHHVARELIDAGANLIIKDKFDRLPSDYALLMGNMVLYYLIQTKLQQKNKALLFTKKSTGNLLLAAYSGNRYLFNLIASTVGASDFDRALVNMVKNNGLDVKQVAKFTPMEQLKLASALSCLLSNLYQQNIITQYVQANIIPSLLGSAEELPYAYGVEMELANIGIVSKDLPVTSILLSWFGIKVTNDHSVNHTIFDGTGYLKGEELVTDVLKTSLDVKKLLFVAQLLLDSGAIADSSTGLHVHVNINGNDMPSIAANMNCKKNKQEKIELAVVKQILLNWQVLEQYCSGIVRDGELYQGRENDNNEYCAPINNIITELLQLQSLEELAKYCDRYKAINLVNLSKNASGELLFNRNGTHDISIYMGKRIGAADGSKGYGTMEFRLHDGTTDPILIKAWLNFINRLMHVSIVQVQEAINNNCLADLKPLPQIENLFYMWIAERDYNVTWDVRKRGFRSHKVTAHANAKLWQQEIRESKLYKAYLLGKVGQNYLDLFTGVPEQEAKIMHIQVQEMLDFDIKYPGILGHEEGYASRNKTRIQARL